MDARGIIAKLRDKKKLNPQEISWFANGLADGSVSDSQAGAFAMAICINTLSQDERVNLTLAMRDSGALLEWDLPGPVVDKHSTGGVGDCVSLLLAPALAALGAYVPMISGRGLGHTGGTLDKLESIPGLNTTISQDRLRQIVTENGCAIVSATGDVAPADKRLYAVRDVTATVPSTDLITASILSKKLAAGLDALVLDVKTGSGAFMKSPADAFELAQALVSTATQTGCPTAALVTDMNQPLAPAIGNAVEVREVMKVLCGKVETSRLVSITCALGGEILVLAGMAEDRKSGAAMVKSTFSEGRACARFERMVADLGGPKKFASNWQDCLPEAAIVSDVLASRAGYISKIDGEALGQAVVNLGGGRLRADDEIDPSVGFSDLASLGDRVEKGTIIGRVHGQSQADISAAKKAFYAAYSVSKTPPNLPSDVYRSIR